MVTPRVDGCMKSKSRLLRVTILQLSILLLPVAAGAAPHSPYIKADRGFLAQRNAFGTTSVGVKIGNVKVFYEHSGHDPQPPPGWVLVEDAGPGATDRITFTIDGAETIRTDSDWPWLGMTDAQLASLAGATSASMTIRRETVEFQPEDFQNLRWKPPADPATELAGVTHRINLAALSAEHVAAVTAQLKDTLERHKGTDARFGLGGIGVKGISLFPRGPGQATDEHVAEAKVFLDRLNPDPAPTDRMSDLSGVVGGPSPTVTIYTTPAQRVDVEAKVLRKDPDQLCHLRLGGGRRRVAKGRGPKDGASCRGDRRGRGEEVIQPRLRPAAGRPAREVG